jgi:hypothetical protein
MLVPSEGNYIYRHNQVLGVFIATALTIVSKSSQCIGIRNTGKKYSVT